MLPHPLTWLELRSQPRCGDRARPELAELGHVISVGDGIALISGLPGARWTRCCASARGNSALRRHLTRTISAACCWMTAGTLGGRRDRAWHRRGRAHIRWFRRCWVGLSILWDARWTKAHPSSWIGMIPWNGRAGDPRPRSRHRAGSDRHPGDRFAVSTRPRPTRADHRRSCHRQDRDRRRHHHQPEIQRPDLRLRRGRAEIRHGRAGDRCGAPAGRGGALHFRRCIGCRRRLACNGLRHSPA